MSKDDFEARLKKYMGSEDDPGRRMSWEDMVEQETFHKSWRVSRAEVDASKLDLIQLIHARLYHDAWHDAMMKYPGKRIWGVTVRFDIPVMTMSYNEAGELVGNYNLVARTIVEVDDD